MRSKAKQFPSVRSKTPRSHSHRYATAMLPLCYRYATAMLPLLLLLLLLLMTRCWCWPVAAGSSAEATCGSERARSSASPGLSVALCKRHRHCSGRCSECGVSESQAASAIVLCRNRPLVTFLISERAHPHKRVAGGLAQLLSDTCSGGYMESGSVHVMTGAVAVVRITHTVLG